MHNPWGILRRLGQWTFHLAPLPAGTFGLTDFSARTLTITTGLDQAQRRSTLAHELEHGARGPGGHPQREELACDQAAARRLIAIRPLGEAIAWSHTLDEAADELWVDRDLLDVRLAHLHPAERAYLKRRLEDGPSVA
ncbi:hypothetical protein [uncultured Nocardioides sp.]|uniref:ImmA/IrrE family metallo-endopeptidase n=1 Tax=uncultured Nocardioides sp. TaxID=198441 RepID=UPI002623CB58|nr:hypothetical protein [uncultured Nocardioides sp.]